MNKSIWPFLILVLFAAKAISQDSIGTIHVIHKVEKDRIILRWAPSNAVAWHSSLTYGYKIERIANQSNKDEMNKAVVLKEKILPWGKEKWTKDKVSSYDSYCIIAAEMLYGKKSEAAATGKILHRADDFKNRYTYAMMAADFSAQAADAIGLRYEDKDIKPGYTYIYKITSLTPSHVYPISQGMDIAYSALLDTLIPPKLHHTESGDKMLHIFWEKEQDTESRYTAFYIEKTKDGKQFHRLNENPYISSNQYGEQFNQYFIYTDSLSENYQNFGYRIVGISPFGELSPSSNTLYGFGRDLTPPKVANQLMSTQTTDNKIILSWSYDKMEEKELDGFLIGRSTNVLDSFENITPVMLNPSTRSFTDENPNLLRPNFYFVTAIDTAKNYAISKSHYAHIIDSIAPKSPVNLKGEALKDGTVKLYWNKNSEPDIMGYTVHYSNHPDHVFAAVTNKPVFENFYNDTVMIRTLSKHVYYKIVAIDRSFNYSSFSEVLKVTIPDIVPPSAALVKNFIRKDKSIIVNWINSTSDDVVKHCLYRKDSLQAPWILVFETKDNNVTQYEDKNIKSAKAYYYKVHAKDEANNESLESTIVKAVAALARHVVEDLNLKVVMEQEKALLTWNAIANAKYYTLYKTNHSGQFITMTTTNKQNYIDVPENNKVKYTLRVTNADGITTDFAKMVGITQK